MVIRWTNNVPDRNFLNVISPKVGKPITVICCGPVVGVMVHWDRDAKCSFPCAQGGCSFDCQQPPRWKGYMAATQLNGRKVIVEVTAGAMVNRPELAGDALVGKKIRLYRAGSRANAAVFTEVLDDWSTASPPPAFDVKPSLLRMWGLTE